jgi:head-tail adaptor
LKSASNAWSSPEVIVGGEFGTEQPPSVVFDANGDASAVSSEPRVSIKESISLSYLVRVAVRPVRGHWQPPDTISHLGLDPEVAIDGRDTTIAIWDGPSGVEEAERPAGAEWLSPKLVLPSGGGNPQVATNAHGDAIIASPRQAPHHSEGIEIAMRSAGSPFSSPQMISGHENAFEPRVAMNARGDALVAWRVDSARGSLVRASSYRADAGWSRPRTVSDLHAFSDSGSHHVAIDERGDAIVVWFAQRHRPLFVEEASRDAEGRWRARRVLAKAGTVERPEVGMDARGDTIVAWWEVGHEWARVRPVSGRWAAVRMVSKSGGPASLAVDRRGDALLAWSDRTGITAAARRATHAGWKTSRVAPGGALAEPTVSIAPSGECVVTWFDEAGFKIAWNRSLFR